MKGVYRVLQTNKRGPLCNGTSLVNSITKSKISNIEYFMYKFPLLTSQKSYSGKLNQNEIQMYPIVETEGDPFSSWDNKRFVVFFFFVFVYICIYKIYLALNRLTDKLLTIPTPCPWSKIKPRKNTSDFHLALNRKIYSFAIIKMQIPT